MDLPAALVFAASLWVSLPHGDSTFDLLETLVPFAFTDNMNTGGTVTGVPQLAGSDGSSWTQATYRLGMLDITDLTRGGVPLMYTDLSALEQVRITDGSAPIEISAPGPEIRILPRRGSGSWRGEAAIAGSPAGLTADGPSSPPPLERLKSLTKVDATAAGPLGSPDRQLFTTATVIRSSHLERNEATVLPGDVFSLSTHFTAKAGESHDWGATGWAQHVASPFGARARFADRNVRAGDRLLGLAGQWQSAGRLPLRVDVGLLSGSQHTDASASRAQGTVERLRDGPVQELATRMPTSRLRVGGGLSVTPEPIGRHTLTFGASASTFGTTMTAIGSGPIGETMGGLPARVWDYTTQGADARHINMLALEAADSIVVADWLSADIGGRFDHLGGSNAATSVGWTSFTPSLALVFSRGPWQATLSARRYHEQMTMDVLAWGDPAAPSANVYRWTDPNGDGLVQPNELGTLIARTGPGTAGAGLSSIDPALGAPHVTEAYVGVERRAGQHWAIQFSGVSRTQRNRLAVLDVGVPASAYGVRYVPDPGLDLGGPEDDQMLPVYSRSPSSFGADQYLLTNAKDSSGSYGGVYLAVVSRGYDRWYLFMGATALRTNAPAAYRGFTALENDDNVIGDVFSDPNSNTYAIGRTFFDRGYGLKLAGSYRGPKGLTVGTISRYADGQNFARYVLFPDLPQGPDVVRAFKNGRTKFTYTLTVDARLAKAFEVGGRSGTFTVDAFNLLNMRNEVEENTLTGPSWRAATAVQPPRVVRIGVRMAF